MLYASNPDERGNACFRGTCTSGGVRTWVIPKTATMENGVRTKQAGYVSLGSMFRHVGLTSKDVLTRCPLLLPPGQSRTRAEENRQGH